MTLEFWLQLLQIMVVNIVLSGDNAVVIAMAAHSLPTPQQKTAILWGSGGAVVLRVMLTLVANLLLKLTFLKLVGGVMLVWIAYQLLVGDAAADGSAPRVHDNLLSAIKTILVADVVMSLDNTLAIAAVAKHDTLLLILGLALSIPIVIFGSTLIMKLMYRLPIMIYLGAGLIAFTAGSMIEDDQAVQPYLPGIMHRTSYLLPLAISVAVMVYGCWSNARRDRAARETVAADQPEDPD